MPNAASKAGVPEGIEFQTKPEIALEQMRQAMEQKVPVGVVLADAAYGNGTQFRTAVSELGLQYAVGIESSTTSLGAGATTLAGPAAKAGPWRATQTPAAQRRPSACFGEAVGSRLAVYGLEGHRLAPG